MTSAPVTLPVGGEPSDSPRPGEVWECDGQRFLIIGAYGYNLNCAGDWAHKYKLTHNGTRVLSGPLVIIQAKDVPVLSKSEDGQSEAEAPATGDEWDWVSAGKEWREPSQSGVDAAARALADEGTLLPLPLWVHSPQGWGWWDKRDSHHLKHGKHKKSTKRALRSWLAYAASKDVYPSVGDAA